MLWLVKGNIRSLQTGLQWMLSSFLKITSQEQQMVFLSVVQIPMAMTQVGLLNSLTWKPMSIRPSIPWTVFTSQRLLQKISKAKARRLPMCKELPKLVHQPLTQQELTQMVIRLLSLQVRYILLNWQTQQLDNRQMRFLLRQPEKELTLSMIRLVK